MKIKTFILLLVASILLPMVILKTIHKGDISKQYSYYNYKLSIKESLDDITIPFENKNDYMELNINFDNNENIIDGCNFIVMLYIDNRQITFLYKNYECKSFTFKFDNRNNEFNIKVPKKYIQNKQEKLTITALKQIDMCQYNDSVSKTYIIKSDIDKENNNVNRSNLLNAKFKKISYNFIGAIMNDDYTALSNYEAQNYNRKVYKIKIQDGKLRVAIRIPNMIRDKQYLIYFTLGDEQLPIKDSNSFISFTPKETGAYFSTIEFEDIPIKDGEYLNCHVVKDPSDYNVYDDNIISNKVLIIK